MEPYFWLGFIAGAVVTSGSVAAAVRGLRTGKLGDYSWWFVLSQVVGCSLYVIYLTIVGAWAGMLWTLISLVCFAIVLKIKFGEELEWA
jgi:hypothetical protein